MNFDLLVKSIIKESNEDLSKNIIDGVRKGLNAQQIAKSLNMPVDVITNALIELKIEHPDISDKVILNAKNSGLSSSQIADQFNITPLSVFYILNKIQKPVDIKPKTREYKRRRLTPERLREYINSGLTYKEIAQRTRYNIGTVMQLVTAYKLQKPVKKKRDFPELDMNLIKRLYYDELFSVPKIAKILKRDKDWLGKKMREYGFKLRSGKESQQVRHSK